METPEIDKDTKIKIPLYLVVFVFLSGISLGGTIVKVLDNDQQREVLKEYMIDEIQGLRTDWERRNKEVEKRLDKLEK